MNFTKFFHLISYLQYPTMLIGFYFVVRPYITGEIIEDPTVMISAINTILVCMGLSVSFSTLQDTTKTQNNISKKIWQDPKKGSLFILAICFMILFILCFGLFGYFVSHNTAFKEISLGCIVLSIGLIGMLKAAKEMFENHRLDKNS